MGWRAGGGAATPRREALGGGAANRSRPPPAQSGGGAVQLPTADSVRFFLQSCCDAQRQGAPTPAVSAVQVRNQLSCCDCASLDQQLSLSQKSEGEGFTWAREPRVSE